MITSDIQVLRKMLEGVPVTLESCPVWEKYKDRITKQEMRQCVGYQNEYAMEGRKVPVVKDLIKRHLITPVVEGDKQTFVVTETGKLVATYEQQAFEIELPKIVAYA